MTPSNKHRKERWMRLDSSQPWLEDPVLPESTAQPCRLKGSADLWTTVLVEAWEAASCRYLCVSCSSFFPLWSLAFWSRHDFRLKDLSHLSFPFLSLAL